MNQDTNPSLPCGYLPTSRIPKFLFSFIIFLGFAGLIAATLRVGFGYEYAKGFVPLFDLGSEGNLPTLFSTMLIAFNGALLGIIGANEGKKVSSIAFRWKVLSFIFFFMAVDEAIGIHELTSAPLRELLEPTMLLTYTWVVIAVPVVAVIAIYCIKLLTTIPRHTAKRFIIAGAIYVGGAVGMEMIGGLFSPEHSNFSSAYAVCYMLEEIMEHVGMALFASALLDYCNGRSYGFVILVAAKKESTK